MISDIARQVAANQVDGEWRWVVEDENTGRPLATGTTRRRPAAADQRYVESRDTTCIHPGCRMQSTESDIDHRRQWAKCGRTHPSNLAPLCRHHHRLKDEGGWTYEPVANGDHEFTSPLGHTYTTSGRSP